MNESISELTAKLKEDIENSKEVLELKEKEKVMEDDETVMALSYRYSCAQSEYSDILKYFKDDSTEAKEKQRALYLAKKNLEENPNVHAYLKQLALVKDMYREISSELFDKFDLDHKCENISK